MYEIIKSGSEWEVVGIDGDVVTRHTSKEKADKSADEFKQAYRDAIAEDLGFDLASIIEEIADTPPIFFMDSVTHDEITKITNEANANRNRTYRPRKNSLRVFTSNTQYSINTPSFIETSNCEKQKEKKMGLEEYRKSVDWTASSGRRKLRKQSSWEKKLRSAIRGTTNSANL